MNPYGGTSPVGLKALSAYLTAAQIAALYSVLGHLHDDRYYTEAEVDAANAAHLAAADPHPLYLLVAEANALYDALGASAASMANHLAAADPHPQYLTPAEANNLYEVIGAVAAHVALADPHPVYLTAAEGDALFLTLAEANALYLPVGVVISQALGGTNAIAYGASRIIFQNLANNAFTSSVGFTFLDDSARTIRVGEVGSSQVVLQAVVNGGATISLSPSNAEDAYLRFNADGAAGVNWSIGQDASAGHDFVFSRGSLLGTSNAISISKATGRVTIGDLFATLTTNQPITSTLALGTAPFVLTSSTLVVNLNADLLDGLHAAAFSLIAHIHDDRYFTEAEINTLFANHVAAADPHAGYLTPAEGNAAYEVIGAVAAHAAAANPHPIYLTEAEANALYATLIHNHSTLLLDSRLILDMPSVSTERGPWNPIVTAIRGSGRRIYPDEDFALGVNSMQIYNNLANGAVTITRDLHTNFEAAVVAPNSSGYSLKISYLNPPGTGGAAPGFGGFMLGINPENNHTFVQIFQAKLAVGRTLNIAENDQGTNKTSYWLTDNVGTGKWEWYARISHCGDSGAFVIGGHIYVTGGADVSFDWYVASATVFDVTEAPNFWTADNDGAGSLLDADLLDGLQAAAFALVAHTHDDRYYTEAESDALYLTQAEADALFLTPAEGNAAYDALGAAAAAVAAHAAAADPHPVYLTVAEGVAAFEALGAVAAHAALADPHPGYLTPAEANALYSLLAHTHLLAAGATDVTMTVANLNSLDDGVDSPLHFHASDRARANHTGTQLAATISDFAAAVAATPGAPADYIIGKNSVPTGVTVSVADGKQLLSVGEMSILGTGRIELLGNARLAIL